ncbi:MAG: ABC transporter permease [Ignavibacteria bacterium]|nr:ABC transporter permease [Ignavibacteria bacterium]
MNNKINTIISHEYSTRIKSKGFIIGTILGPLFIILLIVIPGLVAYLSADSTSKKIAIVDKTHFGIGQKLVSLDTSKYYLSDKSEDELRRQVLGGESDGFVVVDDNVINSGEALVFTSGGGGIGFITSLESNLGDIIKQKQLKDAGATDDILKLIDKPFKIKTLKVTERGEQKDYTEIYAGIGYFLGFVIYFLMFAYGSLVSRGVIEEKANRIIEVIASSAKPFEIMMGKVIGIGLVGLTQVAVWILLGFAAITIAGTIFSGSVSPEQIAQLQNQATMPHSTGTMLNIAGLEIPTISPWLIIGFIYYFLIGYFIYATLFAAIGSAVDQEQDAAQLQTPVTLPIIIPILLIFNVVSNPDGTLAVILSLIPFFTPILMTVRIAATQVPLWQILASIILTLGTFFLCLKMAARIYRVGILMYGKKPTFKDLFKWMRIAK